MQEMMLDQMVEVEGGAWYDCAIGVAGLGVGIWACNALLIVGSAYYLHDYC